MKTKIKVLIATLLIGGAIVGITSDKQPSTKAANITGINHGVITTDAPIATPAVAAATPTASGVSDLPTQATVTPSTTPVPTKGITIGQHGTVVFPIPTNLPAPSTTCPPGETQVSPVSASAGATLVCLGDN